jgi:hypothetical protein
VIRAGASATDGFSAAIDALVDRAAGALVAGTRRARMRWREANPIARLGLDIICSALHEIAQARAIEALEGLPQISAGDWWLAPGAAAGVVVVAADGALVCVDARPSWDRSPDRAELAARDLLGLLEDRDARATAVVALDDARAGDRLRPGQAGRVAVTGIEELPILVARTLGGCWRYQRERTPRLARVLHGARRARWQRARAMTDLLDELDRSWLVAAGVRLPGLTAQIGVLVVGPAGVFVCQPAGVAAPLAASDAVVAARRLAALSRGTGVHVTPVVLCDPGTSVCQLELSNGARAWALPVDRAAASIAAVTRQGLSARQLRRLRHPAPGWEYHVARRPAGWTYEVRYDLRTHERPQSLLGS